MRFFLPLVWAVCLGGTLTACDAYGEPERFFNDDARPPVVATLDVASLAPGQHLAGTVRVAARLDSLAGRIDRVVFAVDEKEVATLRSGPYAVTLATDTFPDGEHVVTVRVYLRVPTGGLLALAGAPDMLLGVPLVFDQRPPTPVALTSVALEAGRARLVWEPSADANFYAYLVVRRDPRTVRPGWPVPSPVIDTVYERSATAYLDRPIPGGIGARAEYEVRVWNRREVSAPSNARTVTVGTQAPALFASGGGSAFSADGQTLYVAKADALVAFSTSDHRERRQIAYAALPGAGSFAGAVRLDEQANEAFLVLSEAGSFRRRIYVLDATTLAFKRSFPLPDAAVSFVLGAPGRALTAAQGRLYVLDRQTGSVVASTEAAFGSPTHVVAATPDGRSAYVIGYTGRAEAVLHRVDVAGSEPRAAAQTGGLDVRETQLGADGRLYLYTGSTATVLDGQSLATVATFDLGLPRTFEARAFVVAGATLYVSYQTERPDGLASGAVAAYALATGARTQSWAFADPVGAVRTTGARWLYVDAAAEPLTTWLVPL